MPMKIIFVLWIALAASPTFCGDLYHQLFLTQEPLNVRWQLASVEEMVKDQSLAPLLQEYSPSVAEKSRGKAFMLSLLVPGLGQHYVNGASFASRFFIGTEAALLTAMVGFHTYGNWREEDYQTFAATHARADIQGKDHTYFVNLGNFISLEAYNAAKLRDRNLPDYYADIVKYYWAWDSDENRSRFYDMRIASDRAFDRVKFTAAGVFANHVVSAIMAMWSAHKYNKKIRAGAHSFNIHFNSANHNPGIHLVFTRNLP